MCQDAGRLCGYILNVMDDWVCFPDGPTLFARRHAVSVTRHIMFPVRYTVSTKRTLDANRPRVSGPECLNRQERLTPNSPERQ